MQSTTTEINTIEEAIADIKKGKVVIVVDDEDRENEGDFFAAAELVTPEIINFMSTYGRGLICTPLPESRCEELDLHLMVGKNTDPKNTAFTVSIDLLKGISTGISATDRAMTIKALMEEDTVAEDFTRPGHIFPLRAREGGVLKRAGHTEAAIDLAVLSGLQPGGVIVEIMNEDGSMARLPQLAEIARTHDIKLITIKDLIEYRLQHDSLIEKIDSFPVKSMYGEYELTTFKEMPNEQLHFALTKGTWNAGDDVLVRVQSSNSYYDLFNSLIKGEEPLMEKVTAKINENGFGAIVFINNVSDSDLVLGKLKHFKQFVEGKKEKPNLPMDDKDLGIGAQILKALKITHLNLMATKEHPNHHLNSYGLEINSIVKL